jgi:hypothetical protein
VLQVPAMGTHPHRMREACEVRAMRRRPRIERVPKAEGIVRKLREEPPIVAAPGIYLVPSVLPGDPEQAFRLIRAGEYHRGISKDDAAERLPSKRMDEKEGKDV